MLCAAMTPTASPGSAKVILRCKWLSGFKGRLVCSHKCPWKVFLFLFLVFKDIWAFWVLDLRKDTEVGSVASSFFFFGRNQGYQASQQILLRKDALCLSNSFLSAHQHLYVYMYLSNIRTQHETHKHQLYIDGYSNDIQMYLMMLHQLETVQSFWGSPIPRFRVAEI